MKSSRRFSQCLYYALGKWHAEGGYIVMRKSAHWSLPHVMHLSADRKILTHFTPLSDLKQPWHSMFGFVGQVIYEDSTPAPRMSLKGILIGLFVLMFLGVGWVAFKSADEAVND